MLEGLLRDKIIRVGGNIMTRLVFETKRMKVAELGEESSVPDLFGELTTQNSLVFDLDEDDEIYEGYQNHFLSMPSARWGSRRCSPMNSSPQAAKSTKLSAAALLSTATWKPPCAPASRAVWQAAS